MLLIILPGYSPHNKTWLLETKEKLHINGEIVAYEWKHWKTGKELDLKSEVSEILKIIGSQEVSFIAKSVGTQVLMDIIPKVSTQVKKVILCGIPVDPSKHLQGIKNLKKENLLVFQNSLDPFMPYNLIEKYLSLIDRDIRVIEKPAATHDYPYYEDFQRFLD